MRIARKFQFTIEPHSTVKKNGPDEHKAEMKVRVNNEIVSAQMVMRESDDLESVFDFLVKSVRDGISQLDKFDEAYKKGARG